MADSGLRQRGQRTKEKAPTRQPDKEKVKVISKLGNKRPFNVFLYSPLLTCLGKSVTRVPKALTFLSGLYIVVLLVVMAVVSQLLWFDNISLGLFLFGLALHPTITLCITAGIVAPALQGSGQQLRKHPLGGGNAVETLFLTFEDQMNEPVQYPGLVGYYGWNYEAAVALGALQLNATQTHKVAGVLEKALSFPNPGYWIQLDLPVFWLYSVGDRIGLFGGLYENVDDKVYRYALKGTREWPRVDNILVRALSWRKFLFGVDGSQRWVWADDVYMAGATLLREHPDQVKTMLLAVRKHMLDKETGLWWHGAKLDLETKSVAEYNGQKWGRAHGWILLMLSRYAEQTGDFLWLEDELKNVVKYQRETGAFGNLVDDDNSPDETSLTSIFVYAVGVIKEKGNGSFDAQAEKAWKWLNDREVNGFGMSDTCGAAPLGTTPDDYNKAVNGLQHGPAIAFIIWARMGAAKLGLI